MRRTSKGSAKKKYTVVGFYEDNQQPFIGHVTASSPRSAARTAYKQTDGASDLLIIDVIVGHHKGVLNNEDVMSHHDLGVRIAD